MMEQLSDPHRLMDFFHGAGNDVTTPTKLLWSCMDDPAWRLDDYSLKPSIPPSHHPDADMVDHQDYALVVTGDVFRWMINNAPLETLQRVRMPCTSH
jgi:cation-transporting P-type ATPase 13A2